MRRLPTEGRVGPAVALETSLPRGGHGGEGRCERGAGLVWVALAGIALWFGPLGPLHAQPTGAGSPASSVAPAAAVSVPDVSGSSAAQEGDVATPDQARTVAWVLDIEAPEPLKSLLGTYLDLARFQEEVAQDPSLGIRRGELRRLVVSAPEQARGLIEAEGYFNSTITTRVGDAQPGEPVRVTIKVDPGPRTVVSGVQLVFENELDQRLSDNDPAARALLARLQSEWALPQGRVFRQADWVAAKNAGLARIRAEGYPTATWSGTSATVDAQTQTAKLFLVADSGPAFYFGDVHVEGLVLQPASAVLNLAPFKKGTPYSEKALLDWQESIQQLNLFSDIFVSPELDPTQAKAMPVVVQVHELPMQTATTGIGVSSDTGPRVSLEHLHRNLLGLDWQAKTKVQLGRKESTGQVDLISHPWPGHRRGLVSVQGSYLVDTDNAVTTSQLLRVGQLREGQRLERTDYVELQRAEVRSAASEIISNATALSYTAQWIFRNVDSQTAPTRGTTTLAQLTAGRSYSALQDEGYFSRAYGRLTGYLPLPWEWRAIARAEGGQVFARDQVSIPDTLLFKAGGEDSVRGYPYRSLGVEKEGVTVGGRVMATGSFELAHPLAKKLPSLLGAVFVDAGDAANRVANLQPKLGYGFGLRYLSPVGPLRLDVAYGTHVGHWRMDFSVGITL